MTADSLFSLKGKTALVTGASYGLGVTFAETLAGAGANLVVAARSLDKLQALAARLTAGGHNVLAVKCDVGNPEDVAATVAEGGALRPASMSSEQRGVVARRGCSRKILRTELFERPDGAVSTVRTVGYRCREVAARQLADGKGGSIVNIASVAAGRLR